RDLGPLGALQSAGDRLRAPRERRQGRNARSGWGAPRADRLPPPRLRRPLPAARTRPPLFLQAVRARRPAHAQGRCPEEGCGGRDAGPRARHGAAHGDVREIETMRILVALALVGAILGSGERGAAPTGAKPTVGLQRQVPLPAPSSPLFSVVLLPAQTRGLMSALWVE